MVFPPSISRTGLVVSSLCFFFAVPIGHAWTHSHQIQMHTVEQVRDTDAEAQKMVRQMTKTHTHKLAQISLVQRHTSSSSEVKLDKAVAIDAAGSVKNVEPERPIVTVDCGAGRVAASCEVCTTGKKKTEAIEFCGGSCSWHSATSSCMVNSAGLSTTEDMDKVDLCGDTCKHVVSSHPCTTKWKDGCPPADVPAPFSAESDMYNMCPIACGIRPETTQYEKMENARTYVIIVGVATLLIMLSTSSCTYVYYFGFSREQSATTKKAYRQMDVGYSKIAWDDVQDSDGGSDQYEDAGGATQPMQGSSIGASRSTTGVSQSVMGTRPMQGSTIGATQSMMGSSATRDVTQSMMGSSATIDASGTVDVLGSGATMVAIPSGLSAMDRTESL